MNDLLEGLGERVLQERELLLDAREVGHHIVTLVGGLLLSVLPFTAFKQQVVEETGVAALLSQGRCLFLCWVQPEFERLVYDHLVYMLQWNREESFFSRYCFQTIFGGGHSSLGQALRSSAIAGASHLLATDRPLVQSLADRS